MRLLVAGAGGHAKVVVDAAIAAGHEVVGIVGREGDPTHVQGVPVSLHASSIDADRFVIAIGDNLVRSKMYAEYCDRGLEPVTVVHPSATIAPTAVLGAGTFVAAGVIVNPDARIGENVILNTGCTVDHDCTVCDHAHIGPNASLCGAVVISDGVLIGVGACAIAGTHVGEWSVIGAGAAVTDDLPASSVCVGVPARPIRREDV